MTHSGLALSNFPMKTWIVTSTLTFAPENYNGLILPLAKHPDVAGLVMVENRTFAFFFKGVLLFFSGLAPRLGWNIMKNSLKPRIQERIKSYVTSGKQALVVSNIHAGEVLRFLEQEQPDLIVNARTRVFFKSALLKIPKLGCINIHHGLLPDQRGLMCDLWARLDHQQSGFSIHQMTPQLDDGKILRSQIVSEKEGPRQATYLNYMESLKLSTNLELQTLSEVLSEISAAHQVVGKENKASPLTLYRKNPSVFEFVRLRRQGVKI